MTLRGHPSLLTFAPGAPREPFLSLLCLLLVGGPLFLLGVVQVLENNVRAFVQREAGAVVFRVVLKKGVTQETAEGLALKWQNSGDWIPPPTVRLADDVFQSIPELQQWMSDPANKLLVTSMPVSVDLQPAGLLTGRADPARLSASLEESPEVDRIFFDENGMRRLMRLERAGSEVGMPLRVLFLCLALAGSLVAGIVLARGAAPGASWDASDDEPSLAAKAAARLPAASGLVATMALACLQAFVYANATLTVVFLTAGQALFLILAGVVLSVVTEAARRFGMPRPHFVKLALLAGTLAVGGLAQSRSVHAATTAPSAPAAMSAADTSVTLGASGSALPAAMLQDFPDEAAVAALSLAQRDELLTSCRDEIEQRDKTIEYLQECLTRTSEERALDEKSETVNRQKLGAAQRDLDTSQRSLSQRYDTLRTLREGLMDVVGAPSIMTGDLAEGAAKSRREVARHLLVAAARQTLTMLENDRDRFREARRGVTAVQNEERRIEILKTHARQSPDEILAEVQRNRSEIAVLRAREAAIRNAPPPPEHPAVIQAASASLRPGATPATASRGGVLAARSAPGTLSLPGARGDEGYLLLCPPGTLIHAVRDGKVLHASPMAGLGGLVTLDHGGGLSTLYADLEEGEIGVQVGQEVKAGEILGTAGIVKGYQGRGGVRFEVRKNGELVKPGEGLPGLTMTELDNLLLGRKPASP